MCGRVFMGKTPIQALESMPTVREEVWADEGHK